MTIWFSSDAHYNHARIIEYCNRPFLNVQEMNEELIKRWNRIVKHNDLIYYLGDYYHAPHEGRAKYFEFISNGRIVHLQGNHHRKCQTYIYKMILHFGGHSVYAIHRPPHSPKEIPKGVSFVLCGHIHDLWKHKWVENIPVINVGVDVWGFSPVSTLSILKYYDRLMKEHVNSDKM